MNKRFYQLFVLVLAFPLIYLILDKVSSVRRIRSLEQQLIGPDERSALRKQVWKAEHERAESSTDISNGADPGALFFSDDITSGAERNSLGQSLQRMTSTWLDQLNNSDLIGLRRKVLKNSIDVKFAGLFRELKLEPTVLQELKLLLAERENTALDSLVLAVQQGFNPLEDPAQFQELLRRSIASVDFEIAEKLGPQKFAMLQDYYKNERQRKIIGDLSSKLSHTSEPLDDSQRALLNNSPSILKMLDDPSVRINDGILSDGQSRALSELLEANNANKELQRRFRAALEAPGTGSMR
jgi:hypothetical protein